MRLFALLAVLTLVPPACAAEYAKPELLIEPVELHAALIEGAAVDGDGRVVVLSVVPSRSASGQIPTARVIDVSQWKAAFGEGTDATAWTERIGEVGIDQESKVVVYDRVVSPNAARIWWILKYWGVEDAAILNGGLRAWQQAVDAGKISRDVAARRPRGKPFQAKAHPERLKTTEQVLEIAGSGGDSIELIDTRSDAEFASEAIPFAQQCEWKHVVDAKTGRMLLPAELASLLESQSISLDKPAVTYCQSGGRASMMAFALELMGAENVSNYYGSMGAWKQREKSRK